MRKSAHIAAPLLASAALVLLAACRKQEMQRCVDENNNVVAESYCQQQPSQQQHHPGGIGYFPLYRYYYGGWGGYDVGTRAGGGGFMPAPGVSYSTTRGGFGSFLGHGGGEGGAGE